jgi:hypothetical protein
MNAQQADPAAHQHQWEQHSEQWLKCQCGAWRGINGKVVTPFPQDTQIQLEDGRWVDAMTYPQYDARKNYNTRRRAA